MMPPSGFVPPRSGIDAPKSFVLLRVLRPYLLRYRGMVALLFLALLVDSVITTVIPFATGFAIDRAILPPNYPLLFRIFAVCASAMLVGAGFAITRDYLYARLGSHVRLDVQGDMLAHLQRLPPSYYARVPQGDILARFSSDLATLDNTIVVNLPAVAICGLIVAINTTALFLVEWRLATLALVVLLLSLSGPRLLAPRAAAHGRELRYHEARALTLVQQNVEAQALVRAYEMEEPQRMSFHGQLGRVFKSGVRFHFINNLVGRTPVLSIAFLQIGLFSLGAYWAAKTVITVGALTSFLLYFNNVLTAVSEVSYSIPNLIAADAGARRIQELLSEPPEAADAVDATPMAPLATEIQLEDVTYSWTGDDLALIRVDLRIPHQTLQLLVGPSGSGKSTLLRLLARLHDPGTGAIRFDGRSVRSATRSSLRQQIAIVFQGDHLLPGTIRENIAAGRPLSDEEVIDAARLVEVHEAIDRLANGYATHVGDGLGLTAAQQQRIAIARALAGRPRLLLLDQATTALDGPGEARLFRLLASMRGERTIIAATTHLRHAALADGVIVLDRGKLVAHGAHAELMERSPEYVALMHEHTQSSSHEEQP